MDRRSVILGSGTALTIALAGCMNNDDDDTEPTDDVQTRGGDGDDGGDGGSGGDGGDGSDGADVPGVDVDDLNDLSEHVKIRSIKLDGKTLVVAADVVRDDRKKAMAELGRGLQKAVKDVESLIEMVDWLEITLFDGGTRVFTTTINVDWVKRLVEEEIDPDELAAMLEDEMDAD